MKAIKERTEKTYKNQGNPEVLRSIPAGVRTILDVGCGAGDNARILISRGKTVDGITISEREAALAQKYTRNIYVKNLETGLPNLKERYDAVICSHVIEHIAFPEKLLNDIRTVLQPNGYLIVALPNLMHYRPRMRLLMGKFEYEESGIWDYTHLRWYTFSSGKKLLENHGFTVEKCWVSGDIPFGRLLIPLLPNGFRKFLFKSLTGISKGLFGGQLLYIARPKN